MGFSSGGNAKGPVSEINVAPLVDVVLVLLIIFMVVTPLLQVNLEADMPKVPDTPQPPPDPNDPIQIVISVKRDGIYLNADRVTEDELATRLKRMMNSRKTDDKIAFVSGEDSLAFGQVIRVMDICRGAEVKSVGIIDPLQ